MMEHPQGQDRRHRELIPEQGVSLGDPHGKLAVVGWGLDIWTDQQAVRRARARGADVSHIHLRYLWPLPRNLGPLLWNYERILVLDEYRSTEDRSPRPVPGRCQAVQQGRANRS